MKIPSPIRESIITTIIALSINIVAGVFLIYYDHFNFSDLFLSITNLGLVILLIIYQKTSSTLAFQISTLRQKEFPTRNEYLLGTMLAAFRQSGFVNSFSLEEQYRKTLGNSKYIRGQNLYNLLTKGTLSVNEEFLFLNDHPFRPFAEVMDKSIKSDTKQLGANSVPDEMYSFEDIQYRIGLLNNPNIEFYLLPDYDLNIAIFIFDRKAAIVYTCPRQSTVCNFSEGLLFTDDKSVSLLTTAFFHYINKAKLYNSDREKIRKELQHLITFSP